MSIIASFALPHPPLIVAEVGRGREIEIQKTIDSYEKIANEISKLKPETIIISSPHTQCFKDYFYISSKERMTGSFQNFGASSVSFDEKIDLELATEIKRIAQENNFPAGFIEKEIMLDHGTMVPLYFIHKKLKEVKIIVIGLSALPLKDHFQFGQIIKKAIDNTNRKVIFIASGDLSHKLQEYGPYGFTKEGPIYEEKIIHTMTKANFDELLEYDAKLLSDCAECGHPSFTIMSGVWNHKKVKPTFYSHEDKTGVGYGIWSYYPEDEYVNLAKESIEYFVKKQTHLPIPKFLSKEFYEQKSGVFVSIHKRGELRGCIGTILPIRKNIAEEIIENAISAATKDPRFPEIREEELPDLEIKVDILTTPERIENIDQLNPKKYGVIVSNSWKKGLLLPDLEGIDTAEEQISIARKKAGITDSETIKLERFEVIRHESPFQKKEEVI